MSPRIRFALMLIAIAAMVPLAWWLFLAEPSAQLPQVVVPSAPVGLDAGPRAVEIRLGELTGSVQIRRGLDGGWQDAKSGDALLPSDGVRTTEGSSAVLVGGETWEVKMEPGTEVGIGDLKESITRLLLESGMAKATVKGQGRHTFEVRATGSDASASTDGGVFTIASNGLGTVAVGTQSGEVSFSGAGRVVIVRAGQQSIVTPGQAPSAPVTIPSSLLLKVSMPTRKTINTPQLVLKGDVQPGSRVEVQGKIVSVDERGHFEVPVSLKEGKNSLSVQARSVGGTQARSSAAVELDTTVKAPTIDPGLWK